MFTTIKQDYYSVNASISLSPANFRTNSVDFQDAQDPDLYQGNLNLSQINNTNNFTLNNSKMGETTLMP